MSRRIDWMNKAKVPPMRDLRLEPAPPNRPFKWLSPFPKGQSPYTYSQWGPTF